MQLDTYQPTIIIEIEGKRLSKDIIKEVTSFVFEDNEEELDVMELSVKKTAVIKEIDYDFPESGELAIHLKAYDKGHQLTG